MGMFLALISLAVAMSGTMAFVLFWPMTLVHLRDRHPALLQSFGRFPFVSPVGLRWLLSASYRPLADRSLSGLATPARYALWATIMALAVSGALWLIYR